MAGQYASGKDAWGICDLSGQRYRIRDMKLQWNGLFVGPDWFEEEHPQQKPRGRVDDLTALEISRPDIAEDTTVAPFELTLASTAGQDTDHAIFHLAIGLSHDREIVLGTRASTTVVPEILVRDRGL